MKVTKSAGLVLVLSLTMSALGQTSAAITGVVSAEAQPLPGVMVTITSPAMQGERTTFSNVNGLYSILGVPSGSYVVKFDMEGLESEVRKTEIGLGQIARVDAGMSVATLTESIVVTAPPNATIQTSTVQTNLQSSVVDALPMTRDFRGRISLGAGVSTSGSGRTLVISGAPSYENLYLVDGAVINENIAGYPLDLFIEDALQETTLMNGSVSAEYGRFTGGVVAAVTKSGSNQFSGSVRDSLQNPRWSSTTPLHEPRAASEILSTYSATLGGPIVQDRIWFFVAGRSSDRSVRRFLEKTTIPYDVTQDQSRIEARLTGALTNSHRLTATYFRVDEIQRNACAEACLDTATLDTERQIPQQFASAGYTGVVSNQWMVELNGSKKTSRFTGSGGEAFGNRATGTPVLSLLDNAFFGSPLDCASCGDYKFDNQNWVGKATYFAASPRYGTHTVVGGFDDWRSSTHSPGHFSESDFLVMTLQSPTRTAGGELLATFMPGDAIVYMPVREARPTNFNTRSLFITDQIDFHSWSLSAGLRYDHNVGKDSSDHTVADDQSFNPRLAVSYAPANVPLKLTASYGEYAAHIVDSIGNSGSMAGIPSELYWSYEGPTITQLPVSQALEQMFAWFDSVGGIRNQEFFADGFTSGITTKVAGHLRSPRMKEWTAGAGSTIGQRGFLRADVIVRRWENFYASVVNESTGTVEDPLSGATVDVTHITTSTDFERNYRGLQVQGSFAVARGLTFAGNYTFSHLRGNHEAERNGAGARTELAPTAYPELLGYDQRLPVGELSADVRHRARVWMSYDWSTRFGQLQLSALQSYESGAPYQAVGAIDVRPLRANAPSYATPPDRGQYFFTPRGHFRWDDLSSTSVGLVYTKPMFGRVAFFIDGEVRNLFDEAAQIGGDTAVLTSLQATCRQSADPSKRCLAFNPFTEIPVEGVHWVKGGNFGRALVPAGHYQSPRTYFLSGGFRF